MTKFDQIKILDNKIKANKAQYMLDRKNAEISAKSSGELDKHEYLTGEDLGYKPDVLTQAKFEYSPLGKTLTFGSTKEDKKEGLLKRLANINKANNLSNLRGINANIYPRDIDYYRLNKDKIDTRRFYEVYNKLESLEENFFMINEFYKKTKNFKNDILSDDINKKTRVLNNTSRVYNNLLKRYKDEYFEKYKQYNEEWKKSMIKSRENKNEKTKQKNDKKDASRTFAPPDPESDDLNKWIAYEKEGFDLNGYNINGINRNGYDINGYNINGYNIFSYDKDGYNINGYDFSGLDRDGYDINGVKGVYDYRDKYSYSKHGYNKYGFSKDGYNKNGYNKYSYNKYGFNINLWVSLEKGECFDFNHSLGCFYPTLTS